MRTMSLQLLTWGTAAAAVSSALWLSATNECGLLCLLGNHDWATQPILDPDMPAPAAGLAGHVPAGSPQSSAAIH